MADAPLNPLSYFGMDKPTLPYRTNTSPVDESPHWVTGSRNIMGTIKGDVEKRPGFSTGIEAALSAIPGTVVRLYTWRRFSGSFFVMASVTTTDPISPSQVWKLEVGVDQSFSMIYADTSSTGALPFDFITSNNFCFFGNMTTRQNMRKFDGTTVSLWGLDFPVSAPSTSLVVGSLPPGLSFSNGVLSGTPTTAGTYSITFTATDASGNSVSQSIQFSITSPSLDVRFPSGPIDFAQAGISYNSSDLMAWGGNAPYTYTLASGRIPPGISLDANSGVLSGVPNAVGDYAFAVQIKDNAGAVIVREFSIFVGDPSISISVPSPNVGVVGTAYAGAVSAVGGVGPYVFSIAGGFPPPGLSMDGSGNISGTPSVPGVYPVVFQVTDSRGVSNQASQTFTISSNVLAIATVPAPPIGKVGYAYSFTTFASGSQSVAQNQTANSTVNRATGDWQLNGTQFRTISEPVVTSLSDLVFSGFGLAVPSNAAIIGITVSAVLVSQASTSGTLSQVALYYQNTILGSVKTPATPFTTSITTQPYGSSTDLWGAGLTPAIVNDASFGFAMAVNLPDTTRLFIGSPFQVTVYFTVPINTPPTVTASPNAMTAQTGYMYGQTFTSIYGHESSMSALSVSMGVFTDRDIRVNLISSADPQVTGINVYRTTDGGDADPQAMRLVASLSNVDGSYIDSTLDILLGLQTGPALFVNNPPQPLNGFVWSNGRIWGINGAYTWFTGNEEVTNGIPEECMSNAANGNFYGWPSQVGGMAVTSNGVDIGVSEQFWQISGDTLATFRKSKILQGGGTRFPVNITSLGDSVLWLDTALQAFSSSDGEFGEPIRPDLAKLDLSQSFIVFHKSKLYNWIVILDALNSTIYVYDLDLSQWNPPWVFSGGVTAITSGEVTVGNVELLVAFKSGHVMKLTPNVFTDDGAEYGETMKSNLLAIVPGRGTSARNAAEVRQIAQFDMEVSMIPGAANDFIPRTPEYFACLVDDDPAQSIQDYYFDLSGNICPPQYQDQTIQKRFISPWRWPVDQAVPRGRRVAFYAQWNPSPNAWNCYSLDVAWRT